MSKDSHQCGPLPRESAYTRRIGLTPDIPRTDSTPPPAAPWLWLVLFLAAFAGSQIVGAIVAAVAVAVTGGDLENIEGEALLIGTAAGGVVAIPLCVLFIRLVHRGSLRDALGAPRRWWWFVAAVLLGVGLVLINGGLTTLGQELDPGLESALETYEDQLSDIAGDGGWQVALFLVAVVILAPLWEELAFRVLLLGGLRRLMPFWPAAAISGAFFAVIHLQFTWAIFLGLFAAGVGLAWIYRRAGYWAAVATHATVNAIAAASLLLA